MLGDCVLPMQWICYSSSIKLSKLHLSSCLKVLKFALRSGILSVGCYRPLEWQVLSWLGGYFYIRQATGSLLLTLLLIHQEINIGSSQRITRYSSIIAFILLAMSRDTAAIGALVLVPIVIAASAAFIAVYTTQFFHRIFRRCRNHWEDFWFDRKTIRRYPRRKLHSHRGHKRLSSYPPNQRFADSWIDLESASSRQYSNFINQSPQRQSKSSSKEQSSDEELLEAAFGKVWHPTRSVRLMWSFTNPRSRSQNRCGLSNVARPLPVAQRPDRSSTEEDEENPRIARMRAGGAHPTDQIDR
jgi:hypothetical protein